MDAEVRDFWGQHRLRGDLQNFPQSECSIYKQASHVENRIGEKMIYPTSTRGNLQSRRWAYKRGSFKYIYTERVLVYCKRPRKREKAVECTNDDKTDQFRLSGTNCSFGLLLIPTFINVLLQF